MKWGRWEYVTHLFSWKTLGGWMSLLRKRHCKGRVWDCLTRQRVPHEQYHGALWWAWNRQEEEGTGRKLVSVLRDLSLQDISQKTSSHQVLFLEGTAAAHHRGFQSDHCLLSRYNSSLFMDIDLEWSHEFWRGKIVKGFRERNMNKIFLA